MYFNVINELNNPGSPANIENYKEELTYKR